MFEKHCSTFTTLAKLHFDHLPTPFGNISRIAIRLFDNSRKLPRFDRDLVIRVAVSFESPLIQNTGLIGRSKNDDRLARGLRGIYRDS